MTTAREQVLAAIRRNRPDLDRPLPELSFPEIPDDDGTQRERRVDEFRRRLAQMGGRLLDPGPPGDRLAPARTMIAEAGVVCSMVAELPGDRPVAGAAPASMQDVDLAVLRGRFAVAETGSIALADDDLGVNALGYLAQRLLILVDPDTILGTLHDAYARPEFLSGHYLVLHTGPSATADIEGVLIHGAQGVRSLTAMLTS